MAQDSFSLGKIRFERRGEQLLLKAPEVVRETTLQGFLQGANHLLKMDFDLEGSAELDGGFIFRIEGERVRLSLGQHAEVFRADEVESLFRRMVKTWARSPVS